MIDQRDVAVQVYPELDREDRLKRLESALSHLAVATEIELADITMDGELSQGEVNMLRLIRNNFYRISQMGMRADESIESVLENSQIVPDATLAMITYLPSQIEPGHNSEVDGQLILSTGVETIDEKDEPKSDLYDRITPIDLIPNTELTELVDPISLEIVSDNAIVFNERLIRLKGDRLFVFNAFMMLRDKPVTASGIRKLGFRLEPSNVASITLSKAITTVREKLQEAAGSYHSEIISRQGQGRGIFYVVNPAVTIKDCRPENEGSLIKTELLPISATVRKGNVVTVKFHDWNGEVSQETFRITDKNEKDGHDNTITLLYTDMPLGTLVLGAKIGDSLMHTAPNGDSSEITIISII